MDSKKEREKRRSNSRPSFEEKLKAFSSTNSVCKSNTCIQPRKKQRWVLSRMAGSLREKGDIDPSELASKIYKRMEVVLRQNMEAALRGNAISKEVLQKHAGINSDMLSNFKKIDNEDVKGAKLRTFFIDYVRSLRIAARRDYQKKEFISAKWINFIPTFQTRFGVSVTDISPYINVLDNLNTLEALEKYFYFLYLDVILSIKKESQWSKLFPLRSKRVKELGLDLSSLDTYEEIVGL
mmetsp:Transcript_16229/g.24470  ORF Transcript_16229/g.24470 Transcript_16229/m.24470 type:complete len:238 (+) Transcript_16229:155-868(+)